MKDGDERSRPNLLDPPSTEDSPDGESSVRPRKSRRRTKERADAAHNRERILAAAERVFTEAAPHTVTMGQLAEAAGVGRATLYRRFSTPSDVAVALLDEHERRLQEAMLHGPPPLGPGAPPAERLAAFYTAAVDLLERHLPLALGAETGARRFATGAYAFWRTHVRVLLVEAGAHDPDALVDVLLTPLDPELYRHQRHTADLSRDRLSQSLAWLARRILG